MKLRHEGCKLLVVLPAIEGELPTIIGATVSHGLLRSHEFDDDTLWEEFDPGLYVWEGVITETDSYLHYEGEMRPATAADLARFGLRGLEQ